VDDGVSVTPQIWKDGVFEDLGSLEPRSGAIGYAINNQGHVVGYGGVNEGEQLHAFLWSGGVMKDIGASGRFKYTAATSISENGLIVGYANYNNTGTFREHAVRFADGRVIELATEVSDLGGWKLKAATGVNNDGVIAGWGTLDGKLHGFMLVPIDEGGDASPLQD